MLGSTGVLCRCFFFSSRRRHTRYWRDWSSDVCYSDQGAPAWSRPRSGRGSGLWLTATSGGSAPWSPCPPVPSVCGAVVGLPWSSPGGASAGGGTVTGTSVGPAVAGGGGGSGGTGATGASRGGECSGVFGGETDAPAVSAVLR